MSFKWPVSMCPECCCSSEPPCTQLLHYLDNLDGGTVEITGWYLLYGPDCTGCDQLNGTHTMSSGGAYVCQPPNVCGEPSATSAGPGFTVCLTLNGTQCGAASEWGGNFYGCSPFTLFYSCNPQLGSFSLGVVMPNNATPIFEQTFPAPADPSHPAGTYVLEPTGASTGVAACYIGEGHDPGTCVVTLP